MDDVMAMGPMLTQYWGGDLCSNMSKSVKKNISKNYWGPGF